MEDFAQLGKHNRHTKYDSSMEKLIPVIETHCSFPQIAKLKLFRLTLFCFVVGNEDMHLKNFSLIRRAERVELSPAYDLLNSSLVTRSGEELALPLRGKKSKLNRTYLVDYYGHERLGLNRVVIEDELAKFSAVKDHWLELLKRSFLSVPMQEKYKELVEERLACLIHPLKS